VGPPVGDLGRIGLARGGKTIGCEKSTAGAQVRCGGYGVYENRTYMYNVVVCLYVVTVPTSRLVRVLCALRCG
jgi:hypothetical protein